ncbi:MAG: response regulator [Bacteriovoracaceae bacterium]|nr:response regulator [Bacteriovoracaceae bacterium]
MSPDKYAIFDNIFEPIVVVNKSLEIEYFNHNFSIFTQSSPRVIKQKKTVDNILCPESSDLTSLIGEAKEKKSTVLGLEEGLSIVGSDARFIAVLKVIPSNEHFVICINDLSIENKLYDKYRTQLDELKETHSQIINADKLSTLGELTAGISHEISNPLTIANGSAEIIEMCLEGDELNDERDLITSSLEDIQEAHARINSIIINMKSYLHQGEEQKEYIHLQDIVDESIKLVAPSYKDSNVDLVASSLGNNIVIFGNKIKIEQVLINLLKNSLYAINAAGIADGEVKVEAIKTELNNNIELKVIDNGPGIPEDIKESIFNTFFTTKDVGEGTGMGLSISQKIIESHQGTIEVAQNEKQGTEFVVTLPALELSSITQEEMLCNNIVSSEKRKKRVLVVDNEVKVLNLLQTFLKESEIQFYGAENVEGALKTLHKIEVDLIIVDLKMPDGDGGELLRRVRNLGNNTPALYLSSKSNTDRYNEDKAELNIAGMIIKPFSKDEVIKTIKLSLGEK